MAYNVKANSLQTEVEKIWSTREMKDSTDVFLFSCDKDSILLDAPL